MPWTRTSITCARSSERRATGSKRFAESGTVSTMPDGAATPRTSDPADDRALAADGRLIRNVRWRLVAWSGLTTLVVLAILGASLYAVAAQSLETTGKKQLDVRAQAYRQRPDPGAGPGQGF